MFSLLASWSTAEAQRPQGTYKLIQRSFLGSELQGKRLFFDDVREKLFHLTPSANSKYESYQSPFHQSRLRKLKERVASFFVKTLPFNCSRGLLNGCVNPFDHFLLKALPLRLYQIKYIPGYSDAVQHFINNGSAIKYRPPERPFHTNNTEFARYPPQIIRNGPMFAKYFHIQQLALINKNTMHLPSSSENINSRFHPASLETSRIINTHHEYVNKPENTKNNFNHSGFWSIEAPYSSHEKETSSIKTTVPDLHGTNQPVNIGEQKPITHRISAPIPSILNVHVTQIQLQNVPSNTGKINISQTTGISSKTYEKPSNTGMQINENSHHFNQNIFISNPSSNSQNSNPNSSSTETPNRISKMPSSPSENSEKVSNNHTENSWAQNMHNSTIHNKPAMEMKSLETSKQSLTNEGQETEKRVFEFRVINSTANVNTNIFNIFADNVQVKPTRLNSNSQINADLPDDKMQEQAYNIELNRTSNNDDFLNIDRSIIYKLISNQLTNQTV